MDDTPKRATEYDPGAAAGSKLRGSAVQEAMARLLETIHGTHKRIQELESRLQPVLSPEPTDPSAPMQDIPVPPTISGQINLGSDVLGQANKDLVSLTKRLEV